MQVIDFSSDNIERLTEIIDALGDTLIKSSFGIYVDHLTTIRLAAERHDREKFEKSIINRGMFGGSGALWEIWIEDEYLRRQFENQFAAFIDQVIIMGINNERVNEIRSHIKTT